jgi:hypothetical protein
VNLLDQEAPGLAGRLQALSPANQRRALVRAAVNASQNINDMEPRIRRLLDAAVTADALSDVQVAEVRAYSELADERYFTAQEQGATKAIWGKWFSKARLAAAIAGAFSGTDLLDVAYELCFVGDDKQTSIALIDSEIQAAQNQNVN